ncbi:amino acid transporter [Streptococcus chenjunshii]|uniref:Amino acid transporter n=1 Tax=Streptococcus chenjunshii TaxID=2173853 RepID=A0A372KNK4_9STRE|nr:amino acid transporter [Streptococcus chenjunshii]AXQ77980.1 amino acid transporter [Streptococcus chenjunshii]RFU51776.1 amino acid transporter [Streptococcus chenjunshii]RFU53865.1 amino acid transporter [Streptococcus chenjunshii]
MLYTSILKSVASRRDVKIFFAFIILPLLVPFLSQTMDGAQSHFGQSFLTFLDLTLNTQYRIILPVMTFSLVVTSVFKDEIDSGIMFLYKDINRTKIFNAKVLSLFTVYGLYLLGTAVAGLLAYYVVMVPRGNVSGSLLPEQMADIGQAVVSIISTILLNLITIVLVTMVSITSKTIQSVLIGVFFTLLVTVSPMLVGIRYLFPSGYVTMSQKNFSLAFLLIIALSAVYLGICYIRGLQKFRKIEF